MPPDLTDLTETLVSLTPNQWLGIPVALAGAVFLALGAQFQHRGVVKVEDRTTDADRGLNVKQLMLLLKRPSWVVGSLMLGLAVLLQLTSLFLAPLIVVQPLGAIALVITALVNARIAQHRIDGVTLRAIILCIAGVGIFVTVASMFARSAPVSDVQLGVILSLLGVVSVGWSLAFVFLRDRFSALGYIVGSGVLYGFVATLAKVVIDRAKTGDFEWLTVLCVVALLAAAALGGYFVQNAYANGPPDLVIAGLTVIDPIVAIGIGVVVLGEATQVPLWAAGIFVVCAAVAIWGVILLSKHHPQAVSERNANDSAEIDLPSADPSDD